MKFRNKRTGEVKEVYSIKIRDEKVYVVFYEKGKEYAYRKENIEVLDQKEKTGKDDSFIIYKLKKQCYKCKKDTTVFTYIVFDDGTDQHVIFPWDRERLLENQNIVAHLQDPSIEYYGLKVVGEEEELDHVLMERFPDNIKMRYSKTQDRRYPMNLCEYCGAIQGWNYIYRQVNEMIQQMQKIDIVEG